MLGSLLVLPAAKRQHTSVCGDLLTRLPSADHLSDPATTSADQGQYWLAPHSSGLQALQAVPWQTEQHLHWPWHIHDGWHIHDALTGSQARGLQLPSDQRVQQEGSAGTPSSRALEPGVAMPLYCQTCRAARDCGPLAAKCCLATAASRKTAHLVS